ncbi:MAG: hypothetical protein U0441_12070 [Polyangiaceae bacterium]
MSFGLTAFQQAADALGLQVQEGYIGRGRSQMLRGAIEGQPVTVKLWRGDYVWLEIDVPFDPPADLHLHLGPAGALSRAAKALFGKHDIEVGDAAFDAAFEIKAHEADRARALFVPELRAMLFTWKEAGHLFHVDDRGVHISVTTGTFYSEPEVATIVQNTSAAVALGRAFVGAMARVPPLHVDATIVDAWRAFADDRGLTLGTTPLRLRGSLARAGYREAATIPFSARVAPLGDSAYGVELRVRVEPALRFDLRVQPARWYDFALRKHEPLGDEAFDAALHVTTDDPDAAKRALSADVRGALLSLHAEHADVAVEEGEVVVRTKALLAPRAFEDVVERMAAVARDMTR